MAGTIATLTFAENVRAMDSLVLLGAAGLDYCLGDPWGWPHPVRAMGWVIHHSSHLALKIPIGWGQRLAGMGLGGGLILGSGAIAWCLLWLLAQLSPVLNAVVAIILLASCFAGRSLRDAAQDVLAPLDAGDLVEARSRLSRYVGRETHHLDRPEILRALLETVSENGVDGVTAPLFYALLGMFIPVIGPVPCAIAYKAASTLDSMVGYRRPPYQDLGWFSARCDDVLTWLPCRWTVFTLSLISGHPWQVWKICQRDGPLDPSPNSGWSEAAYAASLGVQLGGINQYQGKPVVKPLMGDPLNEITELKIQEALRLTRGCFLLWIAIALLLNQFFLRWS
jgi:adenosylcobinamide-phosphate synthase